MLTPFTLPAAEGGFEKAIAPRTLVFPQDHASHAGFQTEWWYVTGNAKTSTGSRFGYQFTVFRRALDPKDAAARGRKSAWAATDLYLGHLAVSDLESQQFIFVEDFQRGAAGLAGATDISRAANEPIRVRLSAWDFTRSEKGWTLKVETPDIGMDLQFDETLPPVAHGRPGEEGLSRKGPQPGQASYYYSVPRLMTRGVLRVGDESFDITTGLSWMDHEFGSNQLSEAQAGWEWFALHLDDGSSVMLYVLRNKDGSIEAHSSGTWIDAAGKGTHLPLAELQLQAGRAWSSPKTGASYAVEWKVRIPSMDADLTVRAAQDKQEIHSERIGVSYYEGAVDVTGTVGGKTVSGDGYLEITGRAKAASNSLGGRL